MPRLRSYALATTIGLAASPFAACKQDPPPPPVETPAPTPPAPVPVPQEPAKPRIDLSGPVPPETSAVFFSVDGAMTPLACFDAEKKRLVGGQACKKLMPDGAEVLLSSEFSTELDKAGGAKAAMCEVGGKPQSIGTPRLDGGAAFDWAAWPKSLGRVVEAVKAETRKDRNKQLSPDEVAAVKAVIAKLAPRAAKGELRPYQKATLELGGDDRPELFLSVVVAHPTDPDRNLFAGLFYAPGGDLASLKPIHTSTKPDDFIALEGAVDLDGDGQRELWVSLAFDGGAGDRVFRIDGDKANPLAPWTCGV
ncbi:MAG: hypothetical protein B7733_21565 [Myxococcales bacterium FL481]|nr:MAG: hypothetical protein B7733_21565 [Myxococcales bacterium FL481]